ncbi:MAG: ImuA family protein [Myxococcota bacterium]
MSEATAVSLDALRARIRTLEGRRVERRRELTGIDALDRLTGGLPQPGLVELHGPAGGGATSLAAGILARHTLFGRPVAWVDLERHVYPPALEQLGVDLRYLLMVRPPGGHEVWAVEQLLRSGCFAAVAVAGSGRLGRGGSRWSHAAERGHSTAIVVGRTAERSLPADLRLSVGPQGITVVRDRSGAFGRQQPLPMRTAIADPWQRERVRAACGSPP